jgi:pyruvate formate-lyase activating enzyme-like uncharacterized protein
MMLQHEYCAWLRVFSQNMHGADRTRLTELRELRRFYEQQLTKFFEQHQERIHPWRKHVQSAYYVLDDDSSLIVPLRKYDEATRRMWIEMLTDLEQLQVEFWVALDTYRLVLE